MPNCIYCSCACFLLLRPAFHPPKPFCIIIYSIAHRIFSIPGSWGALYIDCICHSWSYQMNLLVGLYFCHLRPEADGQQFFERNSILSISILGSIGQTNSSCAKSLTISLRWHYESPTNKFFTLIIGICTVECSPWTCWDGEEFRSWRNSIMGANVSFNGFSYRFWPEYHKQCVWLIEKWSCWCQM